jgi:hypothetical protein
MSDRLDKDSVMQCPRHGTRRPAFVCRHLQHGAGAGFHGPADPPAADFPFRNAWCDDCNRVLLEQGGEWNDVSEGHAGVVAICDGCFADIRQRNEAAS